MATIVREAPGLWHEPVGSLLKRVSWGAIFAGTVVTLVLILMFTLLGLGIGFAVINPATEENPLGGVGIGAGIWILVTTLISIFCGAWVTGRLAGSPRSIIGLLHGITTWGLVTLVSFYLMTYAGGMLVSGVGSIIGRGVALGTQVTPEMTSQAMNIASRAALMAFAAVILGACAGALGGALGTPKEIQMFTHEAAHQEMKTY
jgi:hypothetical protein